MKRVKEPNTNVATIGIELVVSKTNEGNIFLKPMGQQIVAEVDPLPNQLEWANKLVEAYNQSLKFPNGFDSWRETHFEVVEAIHRALTLSTGENEVTKAQAADGHTGLYTLAEELTNEFEKLNAGRQWDGEFYEEIEAFCSSKLKTVEP